MARILIIDDEELVRSTLVDMLQAKGHAVIAARNGREGIEHYRALLPDLVITDILMPEQEGIETIRMLRKEDPEVRIVAISGGGRIRNTELLDMARDLGADVTLRKPLTPDELWRTVDRMLAHAPEAISG